MTWGDLSQTLANRKISFRPESVLESNFLLPVRSTDV